MKFKTKLFLVQISTFIMVLIMLVVGYVYLSAEYHHYMQTVLDNEIKLKQQTIKSTLSEASTHLQKNREFYKKVHAEAIQLYKNNPNSELSVIKQQLVNSFKLPADDIDVFLINADMVVFDGTLKKDIGYHLSSFHDATVILNQTFADEEIHLSELVSQDLLDATYKVYSYAKVKDDTILELSFVDQSTSNIFDILQQHVMNQGNYQHDLKTEIFYIYDKDGQFFYLQHGVPERHLNKQEIYEQAQKFDQDNHGNDPIMQAYFTQQAVSYEDQQADTYYYYSTLFNAQSDNAEFKDLVVEYQFSLEKRKKLFNKIKSIFLVIAISALLMIIGKYVFFRRQLIRPIDVITTSIQSSNLVPIDKLNKTKDEFYQISNAYNSVYHGLHQEIDKNAKQAYLDSLTNVGNRKAFDEKFEYLLNIFQLNHKKFCIILIDIDNFKIINDHFGHSMGDKVLKSLAKLTKDTIRRQDNFYRIGGEEFVILLEDTSLELSLEVAERLRLAIEDHFQSWDTGEVTASMGLTESKLGDSYESIYKRADGLLYDAKHKGKNRVCFSH